MTYEERLASLDAISRIVGYSIVFSNQEPLHKLEMYLVHKQAVLKCVEVCSKLSREDAAYKFNVPLMMIDNIVLNGNGVLSIIEGKISVVTIELELRQSYGLLDGDEVVQYKDLVENGIGDFVSFGDIHSVCRRYFV